MFRKFSTAIVNVTRFLTTYTSKIDTYSFNLPDFLIHTLKQNFKIIQYLILSIVKKFM